MNSATTLKILHLEDEAADAELVARLLQRENQAFALQRVTARTEYLAALAGGVDLVLSDSSAGDLDGFIALEFARGLDRPVPFVFVCGGASDAAFVTRAIARGADACVAKSELERLLPAIAGLLARRAAPGVAPPREIARMERLVLAVQDLSLARSLDAVTRTVRRAARDLAGADGATFVLRSGDECHYADEDAIAPLWKGMRFPMSACISGWAMLNRRAAVIPDIYADPRIPHDAYRPTFVKSLAMVPIRTIDPIAAIGVYWATTHEPSAQELHALQALADSASVAMESVNVWGELDRRVRDRTAELAAVNRELESFCAAISHDLRAPLRHMDGFARALEEDCARMLDPNGRAHIARIRGAVRRMSDLVEDLLRLSRTSESTLAREDVDLGAIATEVAGALAADKPVDFRVAPDLRARGDARLLRAMLENLLSNAWKFSARNAEPRVEVGRVTPAPGGIAAFFVADNGVGFDMAEAAKLFQVFTRLHAPSEFPGSGVGLATVQRIVHKHGGRIWADAVPGRGATFFFTLPDEEPPTGDGEGE